MIETAPDCENRRVTRRPRISPAVFDLPMSDVPVLLLQEAGKAQTYVLHMHARRPCMHAPSTYKSAKGRRSQERGATASRLRRPLQQLEVIKFNGVPRRYFRRNLKKTQATSTIACKCDCDDTMRRSTPTRRATQTAMADILAMLYRLMDR
jgi:hypothetical protein